jgi:hypothetical protein
VDLTSQRTDKEKSNRWLVSTKCLSFLFFFSSLLPTQIIKELGRRVREKKKKKRKGMVRPANGIRPLRGLASP